MSESFELIVKPWGSEELIEVNGNYVLKKLQMNKGHRCSLQYHRVKHETIYVLVGQLQVSTGTSQESIENLILSAGDSLVIKPGVIHRMEALEASEYLEASTPELDDVVRLSDDYKR